MSSNSSSEPPSKRRKFTEDPVEPLKMQTDRITLFPVEQLLRKLLLECRDSLPAGKSHSKLDIRFTGGWVRDKLLGIQSPDIDVALSTMTGMQFGLALQDFVSGNGTKYEEEAQKLGVAGNLKGLHQIAANPEKSKHLETVTTRIFGLDIDLVNLRKETYTEDSRNPQMEFGTAEEDALRRDATVNALFYNLDTEKVEDLTSKGLQDMAAGIIRTPLEPHQTFMDDPLRVLRLIRFASKLGYTIDEKAKMSMRDDLIHDALKAKISRERVGVEVGKMMNGPHPLMAFQLIHDLNLYATVFLDPTRQSQKSLANKLSSADASEPWPSTWPNAFQVLSVLVKDGTNLGKVLTKVDDKPEVLWVMAAYAPLLSLGPVEAVKDAREGIKATNRISKILEDALKHQGDIRSKVELVSLTLNAKDSIPRSTVGFAIKTWGPTWRTQVLYSILAEVVLEDSTDGFFSRQFDRYAKFVEYVLQQRLQDAAVIRPLLRGDEIQQVFGLKKSGPWMKTAIDHLLRWQFDHEGASKMDAQQWLLGEKEVLGIS